MIKIANQQTEVKNVHQPIGVEVGSGVVLWVNVALCIETLDQQVQIEDIHEVVIVGITRSQEGSDVLDRAARAFPPRY